MKILFTYTVIPFLLFSLSCSSQSQQITDGSLELISDRFSFTEGPATDKAGNVFFTDQPNNHIWKYDTNGELSLFMDNAGRSNGLYFDNEGLLIACADENYQLWAIHPNGHVDTLLSHYQHANFNGPNDVWVSPNDIIYFTDPYYQRDYWNRTNPDMEAQGLYMYKNGVLSQLDSVFNKPNGIIGSADGKLLYVADIDDNKTYRYHINKDGSLSNKTLFVEQGSDGMTLDEKGNLYLTGHGVTVYNPDGIKIDHIEVPASWTANVCFGGIDKDFLFITASERIFKIKTRVKGQFR